MSQETSTRFSDVTTFNVELTDPSDVDMEVFDTVGRRVWATHLDDAAAGQRTIMFQGRDRSGKPLKRGTYYYRVSANGATITRKIRIER
jgi:flagellar hook assembly protein FlgD